MQNNSEDISIKEIITSIRAWVEFLFSKWKIIIICSLIGSAIGVTYSFLKKPIYTAELTFALEEKSTGGGLGAYAGIASQFGIDIGTGGGGAFSGDNMLELMKSRLLIEKTLLAKLPINGKQVTLVDLYIDSEGLRKKWAKKTEFSNLNFNGNANDFTLLQDSLLGEFYKDIKLKKLNVTKTDKKLNIVSVKCSSKSENFSKYFTEELVKNVSAFYIETKTKKSRVNVELLQSRTDSVKRELEGNMYEAAVNQDQNINVIRAKARVTGVKKQMNVQMLSTMYGELVKNLEISKLALMRDEPLIQVIDSPILPLQKERFGKFKGILLGGFLFGFITISCLIIQKLIRTLN